MKCLDANNDSKIKHEIERRNLHLQREAKRNELAKEIAMYQTNEKPTKSISSVRTNIRKQKHSIMDKKISLINERWTLVLAEYKAEKKLHDIRIKELQDLFKDKWDKRLEQYYKEIENAKVDYKEFINGPMYQVNRFGKPKY